jgi:hypothetical protein
MVMMVEGMVVEVMEMVTMEGIDGHGGWEMVVELVVMIEGDDDDGGGRDRDGSNGGVDGGGW